MERRGGDCELLRAVKAVLPLPPLFIPPEKGGKKITKKSSNATRGREDQPPPSSTGGGDMGEINVGSKVQIGDEGSGVTGSGLRQEGRSGYYESEAEVEKRGLRSVNELLRKKMSSLARTEVLLQLSILLNQAMLEAILSPSFVCNEWGALLLHQEALSLVNIYFLFSGKKNFTNICIRSMTAFPQRSYSNNASNYI